MKKSILLLGLVIAFFYANSQVSQGTYGVKSGYVEYELTGNPVGTKKMWWDDYGAKSYTETNSVHTTKIFRQVEETKKHEITIVNGMNYWTIDKTNNKGYTGVLPIEEDFYDEYNDLSEKEKEMMIDSILVAFGGERVGNEKLLGYDCQVFSLMYGTAKSWNYKGVNLKIETKVLGQEANEIAKEFKQNISIPSSKFEKIAGIEYQTISTEGDPFGLDMFDGMYDEEEDDDDE
jgi:hypothetical protein